MAMNGNAFAVELDRMRAAYGSRDAALLADVLEKQRELIEEIATQLDDPGSGRTMRAALEGIIEGECHMPEDGRPLYGYAIEVLCHQFGEVVPVPNDPRFNEIGDPGDLDIKSQLLSGERPLPVPGWHDTPLVRFLTADQVAEEHQRLAAADLNHHEYASITEGRKTLVYQLGWTRDRGRAFVTVVNG